MSESIESREPGRRSGYRPDQPIQTAPLFKWPPQPRAIFKWLFGFPGYLWPWTAIFVSLAVVSWLSLTPEIDKAKSFSADWIALLVFGNLTLLVAFAGVWHARLYVQKAQGTDYKYNSRWLAVDDPAFLFRNQLRDNIFWSVCSGVPIWTAYEALTLWLQANGFTPTVSWQIHPGYCVFLVFLTPVWIEVHFYAIHRLLHWKPLYRSAHYLHHRNINVGPWSGLAMHPVEHLLYFSGVILYWFIPSHPLHSIYYLLAVGIGPTLGHHGFDRLVLGKKFSLNTDHYVHYLHHKYVTVNYGTAGGGLLPLDRWLGTLYDGFDDVHEAVKKRARSRLTSEEKMGPPPPHTQNGRNDP
jgi:sterol desaturase/sphingolipid hydroxylase (fatty acid hydroxylase superfamily)